MSVHWLVCWLYSWLVGRSVGWLVCGVTQSFDDPHVAPYWPTWPCSTIFGYFQLKLSSIETLCSLKWCQHNVLSLGHVTLELCQSVGPLVCWSVGLLVHTCIEMLTVFCFSAPTTVLLKKLSVESHITVGFSAFLSSIGVYEHVTSKNKIFPRAFFE